MRPPSHPFAAALVLRLLLHAFYPKAQKVTRIRVKVERDAVILTERVEEVELRWWLTVPVLVRQRAGLGHVGDEALIPVVIALVANAIQLKGLWTWERG